MERVGRTLRGIKSQKEFICALGVRIARERRKHLFHFVSDYFPQCVLVAFIDHDFVNVLWCGS